MEIRYAQVRQGQAVHIGYVRWNEHQVRFDSQQRFRQRSRQYRGSSRGNFGYNRYLLSQGQLSKGKHNPYEEALCHWEIVYQLPAINKSMGHDAREASQL